MPTVSFITFVCNVLFFFFYYYYLPLCITVHVGSRVSKQYFVDHRKALNDEVLPWLRDVTGFELTDRVDITCSRYDHSGSHAHKPRA